MSGPDELLARIDAKIKQWPNTNGTLLRDCRDYIAANAALAARCGEVDRQLSRVLHEMAGAVSLCWNPRPTGVFDSTKALEFVSAAIAELRALASQAEGESD